MPLSASARVTGFRMGCAKLRARAAQTARRVADRDPWQGRGDRRSGANPRIAAPVACIERARPRAASGRPSSSAPSAWCVPAAQPPQRQSSFGASVGPHRSGAAASHRAPKSPPKGTVVRPPCRRRRLLVELRSGCVPYPSSRRACCWKMPVPSGGDHRHPRDLDRGPTRPLPPPSLSSLLVSHGSRSALDT